MKIKFFDMKNLVVSGKAIVTSIITGLIWAVPMFIFRYLLLTLRMPIVGLLVGLLSLLGYLLTWGFISRKLWRWS